MTRLALTPFGTRNVGDSWPDTLTIKRTEEIITILPDRLGRDVRPVYHWLRAGAVRYANGDGVVGREFA